MAATLVQQNEGAQNTGLATVTASYSGATTSGNLLVAFVASDDYAATPPTGWTESTGCKQQTFLGHYVWWRVSNGLTNFQYTIGSASPSCWIVAEYSGMDSSPYDISNGQFAQSAASTYTTPSITPTAGDRLVIASIGGSRGAAGLTDLTTWLNSFAEVADINTVLASGTRDIVGFASLAVTANGSTAYSSGATYNANPDARTGITIAFKVASATAVSPPPRRRDRIGALLQV